MEVALVGHQHLLFEIDSRSSGVDQNFDRYYKGRRFLGYNLLSIQERAKSLITPMTSKLSRYSMPPCALPIPVASPSDLQHPSTQF